MSNINTYIILVLLLVAFVWTSVYSQDHPDLEIDSSDTLDTLTDASPDSLDFPPDSSNIFPDSTSDSLKTPEKKSNDLDTSITYQADSIFFNVNNRSTLLFRKATVSYKDMELSAGKIVVDWDKNLLRSMPLPDTTWRDSMIYSYDTTLVAQYDRLTDTFFDSLMVLPADSNSMVIIDTIRQVGNPVFIQKGDALYGDTMFYNIKTKKGFVIQGKTDYGEGYYYGSNIKKVGDKTMNVGSGDFTTCDLDTPHFHFHSKQMKLVVKDKVIAKPVVMYFGKVPIFPALPFGIFPAKSGRQSGIIFPYYGESSVQGRFLKNLGYYYAPSPYWDTKVLLDFYEEQGVLLDGNFRYRKLYRFDGRVEGSYTHLDQGTQIKRRWDLRVRHNQTITPTAKLSVDGTYVSDGSFYKDLSSNPADRMNRIIRSNATFTDRYDSFGGSMTVNLNHEQNLDDETTNSTIPRVSFRLGQKSFFPKAEDQDDLYWYNKIYYSAGSNFNNKQEKKRNTTFVQYTVPDTSGQDSTYTIPEYDYYWNRQGMLKNSYTISSAQTLLKYFSINPGVGISQDFTDYRYNYYYNEESGQVQSYKEDSYQVRHTFNFSTGLNTKMYGIFPANFWKITSFRHVLTPSVTYAYTPDFSDNLYGYYQYVTHPDGTVTKHDRYYGQMIGGTPGSESQSLTFNLSNLFQMKREFKEDDEDIVQKFDLFNWNLRTNYNLSADQFKWGVLSSSINSTPIQNYTIGPINYARIDLSTNHDFYATNANGAKIDNFYFEQNKNWQSAKLLRMTSLNLTATFTIAPPKKSDKEVSDEDLQSAPEIDLEETNLDENDPLFIPSISTNDRFRRKSDFDPIDIPWRVNTVIRYTWNRPNPILEPTKTLWLENSLELTLTKNWSINYHNRYDLVNNQLVSSGFTFYRDMHCWQGLLIWDPVGVGGNYFMVKISVQAQSLRDLKIEKREGQGGYF